MNKLQNQIAEGLKKALYFNEPHLDHEDPRCTANEYFKEISYMVDLTELYKVHGTCYYHDQMKYCPIFLEIKQEKVIKGYNDNKYLIQVWDMNKTKIYEKALNQQIKRWQICYNYFLYTLDGEGDDCDYLHIVNLESNNSYVRVRGFGTSDDVQFISYANQILFAATHYEITAAQIPSSLLTQEGATVNGSDYKQRVIKPGMKIHGLLLNEWCLNQGFQLVALENKQNILDFNRLFIDNINDDDSYGYRWTQYREITPRKAGYVADPIAKCCFIFSGGFNYSIALKESGKFELYWNMFRQEQMEDKYAIDVAMTTDAFYFKLTDGNIYYFYHRNTSSVSFAMAEPVSSYDLEWEGVVVKKVQNYVYLYTAFKIFCIYGGAKQQAFVSISHGKFISIFNITEWCWLNHLEFQDDIIHQFTHKTPDGSLFTSCLTKKGWIYIGFMYDGGKWQSVVQESWRGALAEGEVLQCADDIENHHTLFVLHKLNGKKKLSLMYQKELKSYDELITDQERCSVVCIKTTISSSYVLIQNGPKVGLYQTMTKDGVFKPYLIKEFPAFSDITGTIHSATSNDVDKHLFLFDEKNMYVIEWDSKSAPACTAYTDLYCIGIQHFTKSYNYALCQDKPGASAPGLRLFDMESVIKRKKSGMVLLKSIDVGTQGFFEYSFNLIRIGFVKSLTNLAIIPILHRNMNKFMGMAEPGDYLCYKIIKDKMLALTQEGVLFTWVLSTGKMVSKITLPEHNYSDYDLAMTNRKGLVCLKSKATIPDMNDADYFQPFQFETSLENQKVVLKQGFHTYKRFKWIEIVDEDTVKVVLEYIHPSYDYQRIFLNKSGDRMIESLQNYKTFLYKKVLQPGQEPHLVKWEYVRSIEDFPTELNADTYLLEFFSPCFSKYVITEQSKKQFLIKDTYLDKVTHAIPSELMTFKAKSEAQKTFNRFKWIDSSSFLIVNEEGIEKIIDIEHDFSEVAYNSRPLFTEINGKEWESFPYYVKRNDAAVNETLQRLQRCYQQYKSSYFLFNKRSMCELYQDLISVDTYKNNYPVMSFTFLHWSLIEQIQAGKLKVDELEESVVQQIIYNILPGGNTVLHKLADNEDELIKIFKISHPDIHNNPDFKYHIPFLPNIIGETPIHKCIQKQDYKSIDTILKYLKFYPTDHHSRGIKNLYGEMIEKVLPEFLPYLDSRFQQTHQTERMNKGSLDENSNGIVPCELWYKEDDFNRKLMKPRPIETRIKCEFLDLPGVYHYKDGEFQEVFEALSNTEKIEFFNLKSVQKVIEFNYPLVRKYVVRKLFIPFCFFQLIFFYFMNFIYEDNGSQINQILFWPFLSLNLLFATYFVINEFRQLSEEGISYFSSFWNYIDLIPPLGMYIIAIMLGLKTFGFDFDDALERSILAVVTFFMWMKFLYFLRIFRNTGYLIRMIIEVVKDMRHFFLVLLITIAAFGDSFLTLSYGNPATNPDGGSDRFVHGFVDAMIYTYRMILGDFEAGEFGNVAQPLVMALFLLCTIFNMVVMLNLLIAIISDSYAKITNQSAQATYQERCSMIAENNYLIPDQVKLEYAEMNKYLMVVTDLEAELQIDVDPIIEHIELVKEHIDKEMTLMKKSMEEQNNKISDKQLKQDERMDDLKRYILSTMARQKVMTKIHDQPLESYIFEALKLKFPQDYPDGWYCDGTKKSAGCRDPSVNKSDVDVELYHCAECSFDLCEGCFKFYGNTKHQHELERMTLARVQEIHGGGYSSWGCDGRNIKNEACLFSGLASDSFGTVYHSADGVDLCEGCVNKYRKE